MDFTKKYDVVVAGGGIAGVAAALAAAGRGKKTVLLEKTVFPGGLATTGLIYIYLPICDGNGTQVSFGLTEELLKASLKYGFGDIPENWTNEKNATEAKRYRVRFSPASFILAMDEMLADAGVDFWLDTVVSKTVVKDNMISAVEVVNKSGTGLIEGKCFIDCTGDADLAYLSGCNCPVDDNAIALWAIESGKNEYAENIGMYRHGGSQDPRMGMPGINGKLVSDFVLSGRKTYRERLAEDYNAGNSDRKSRFPLTLPAMAQLRMTRRIDGIFTLEDGMEWTSFDDSIGMGADWRKSGYVWEIPYRSLLPKDLKGLLAAGRCMSSAGDAWDVMRVIPVAAVTGEAAGVAASLSIDENVSPDELNIKLLQQELRDSCGFPLHFEDVGLSAQK